jgi:cytidylate kinase
MSSPLPLQIAIDGPAGAGKSTVARQVAEAVGFTYVDTGAMYRAVAWAALDRGLSVDDEDAICALVAELPIRLDVGADGAQVFVGEREVTDYIRTPAISRLTSPLSAISCVRERLAGLQKEMGAAGGVVMEGRDIGTVVLPQAAVKVFLTASLAQRARRRQAELSARGSAVEIDALEREIAARDARDGGRALAPMVPAPDAVVLDTDTLSVDEVVARIVAMVAEASKTDAERE